LLFTGRMIDSTICAAADNRTRIRGINDHIGLDLCDIIANNLKWQSFSLPCDSWLLTPQQHPFNAQLLYHFVCRQSIYS